MKSIKLVFILLTVLFFIRCTSNKSEVKESQENKQIQSKKIEKLITSVRLGDQWFFINEQGDKLFDKTFTYASEFNDGISCVAEDGQRTFDGVVGAHYYGMNSKGEKIDNLQSDMPFEFMDGHAFLTQGERTYFVDTKGNVIKFMDDVISAHYKEERCIVLSEMDFQIWNKEGDVIKNLDDISLSAPSDGLMLFSKQGKYGYMDKNANVVQDAKYVDAFEFKEGLARIKELNGDFYYINKKFEKVLGPFEYGRDYSDGVIAVIKNVTTKFIDKEGNLIVEGKFEQVDDFHEGFAMVVKEDQSVGFINKNGDFTPIDAKAALGFKNGLAIAEKDGKLGFINTEAKWVIPAQYERVNNFNKF